MRFVIASFNRSEMIKDKTLAVLEQYNIPKDMIDIVVETEALKEKYNSSLSGLYNIIVSGTKGLGEKRNFVRWYYRNETDETELIQLDDDLDDIKDAINPNFNLLTFCEKAFELSKISGATFWGISDYSNLFYIKNSKPLTTNLKLIIGGFSGLIIDRNKEPIYGDCDSYEDIQFTCEHFLRDGLILRFNHIYLKTKLFIPEGGMFEDKGGQEARVLDAISVGDYIYERYKPMVRWKETIKNKHFEKIIKMNGRFKC